MCRGWRECRITLCRLMSLMISHFCSLVLYVKDRGREGQRDGKFVTARDAFSSLYRTRLNQRKYTCDHLSVSSYVLAMIWPNML